MKMDVAYSTGERLQGPMGTETVNIGGITVPNVTIGIAEKGFYRSDGNSSGVIGMGFPIDTRAVPFDASDDDLQLVENIVYNPLFPTMHEGGYIQPSFSVAFNRPNEPPGVLALGGLPGLPIRYEETFTTARFEYLIWDDGSYGKFGNKNKEYSLYMIKLQGFRVADRNVEKSVNAILDTGSPINYVPPDIAEAVNRKWKPAAKRDMKTAQWIVDCDAIAPEFSIRINGTALKVSAEDMLVRGGIGTLPEVSGAGKCLSTIQQSGSFSMGIHILGLPFLKNVVAVFDAGAAEMRFARRLR
jgi:hypothetical protein